jgi:hypothetical protein
MAFGPDITFLDSMKEFIAIPANIHFGTILVDVATLAAKPTLYDDLSFKGSTPKKPTL